MIQASVQQIRGIPTLHVNGQPIPENAYITYFTDRARYDDFADIGFGLFSVTVMFSSLPFSVKTGLPALHRGVFEGGEPDFTQTDELYRQILRACPNAYIFPRLDVSATEAWENEYPDELLDEGFRSRRRACFSSALWFSEVERMLRLYIRHIETTDFRDHIIGYQLSGGNTQEWFPFDEKGGHGKRSREAFDAYCREKNLAGTEPEYYRYLSENTADIICRLCHVVKEETDGRLLAGAFYGYTFECPNRARTHHDLARVLRCADVDFLSSPVSYAELRRMGIDEAYMVPVDSLTLHGKLYLSENDARTHLTEPPNDLPAFQTPIWQKLKKPDALESMRMQATRALTHGAGFWWFDMWGGWYADEEYLALAKRSLEVFTDALKRDRTSRAEFAVFTDETALCRFPAGNTIPYDVLYNFRIPLGGCGAMYDVYLSSDYAAVKERYRAVIVLKPCESDQIAQIEADCQNRGIPCLALTPENCSMTSEDYRSFLAESGVTLMTDRPAVVYAAGEYLYLYTLSDGEISLTCPDGKKLLPLTPDAPAVFPAILPEHRGLLYRLADESEN